ncbi:hypothetical protein LTR37_010165 [Vermiconidia calcicola]|uniref:Uncharacterized protein n=1 Tax=Vermiconidia calcicola TaxID=1690605 RepID=A0ACC3N8Q5_9PEZI|nr:hypothetical protein LTR37_010165 [Vermiconidia calcicola]
MAERQRSSATRDLPESSAGSVEEEPDVFSHLPMIEGGLARTPLLARLRCQNIKSARSMRNIARIGTAAAAMIDFLAELELCGKIVVVDWLALDVRDLEPSAGESEVFSDGFGNEDPDVRTIPSMDGIDE